MGSGKNPLNNGVVSGQGADPANLFFFHFLQHCVFFNIFIDFTK